MTRSRSGLIGLGLGLALVAPEHAGAQLSGSDAFAARSSKGCGGIRQALGLIAVARSDGTWDAQNALGSGWSGTHAPRGSSGRELDLQIDGASRHGMLSRRTPSRFGSFEVVELEGCGAPQVAPSVPDAARRERHPKRYMATPPIMRMTGARNQTIRCGSSSATGRACP